MTTTGGPGGVGGVGGPGGNPSGTGGRGGRGGHGGDAGRQGMPGEDGHPGEPGVPAARSEQRGSHNLAWRLATGVLVVLACLSLPASVALFQHEAVDRRNDLCHISQQNYDAISRILETGDKTPLVLPASPDPGLVTKAYIGEILTDVNARTDRQNAAITAARGPRPTC